MARGAFSWGAKRLKWARSFLSQWNRKVNELEYADSVVGLYDVIPDKMDMSYLKSHIGSQAQINAFQRRLERLQASKNPKGMEWVDTPRGRMRVPKSVENERGQVEILGEVQSKKEEVKRQNKAARKSSARKKGIINEFSVEIPEDSVSRITADQVFSNNRNVESLAEEYLKMIDVYDDDFVLTDTVEILNWYLQNAPEKLSDIYDGSSEVPQIYYVYDALYNYAMARSRAATGVKSRRTKTGLSSVVNSRARVNRINQWWERRFQQDFGQSWS